MGRDVVAAGMSPAGGVAVPSPAEVAAQLCAKIDAGLFCEDVLPCVDTLRLRFGCSERTMRRALQSLVTQRRLTLDRRGSLGGAYKIVKGR